MASITPSSVMNGMSCRRNAAARPSVVDLKYSSWRRKTCRGKRLLDLGVMFGEKRIDDAFVESRDGRIDAGLACQQELAHGQMMQGAADLYPGHRGHVVVDDKDGYAAEPVRTRWSCEGFAPPLRFGRWRTRDLGLHPWAASCTTLSKAGPLSLLRENVLDRSFGLRIRNARELVAKVELEAFDIVGIVVEDEQGRGMKKGMHGWSRLEIPAPSRAKTIWGSDEADVQMVAT